ncbi:MAG: hypothetical protein OQK12_16835 [Motiliproteus sp.]|nr:hypothetical protein [Motiliproteus sp.]MCW9051256.1 hypothetical protein [Motiliproteus sp.]
MQTKRNRYYAKSARREAAERARDRALEMLRQGGLKIKQSSESEKGVGV